MCYFMKVGNYLDSLFELLVWKNICMLVECGIVLTQIIVCHANLISDGFYY